MTREEIKSIVEGITDDQLKSILDINSKDIGKAKGDSEKLKTENENLKNDKKTLEDRIQELSGKSGDAEAIKKELDELKTKIKNDEETRAKEKADAELTQKIETIIGDKKFTSDYARQGVISEMKIEIAKKENADKGWAEIFEAVVKDKEGIIANPNPPAPDMLKMGDNIDPLSITKEQFAKMSYKQRVELYNADKETYNKLKE